MARCPISCGECCDQWAYIDVLWARHRRSLRRDDMCPHLGAGGCTLARNRRPKVCLDFLCERALQVLNTP